MPSARRSGGRSAAIDEAAWTTITCTDAAFDAEAAEIAYTALTGKPHKRPGHPHVLDGQGELLTAHRFHACPVDLRAAVRGDGT
ncbi:hypothetical protein [Streptomyces sp. 4F14]|uniref:hypothetical protein n=1 Tax=Streptomyces sp. 4F14 TaxID=3394380 RepID=UPI003A847057